MTLDLTDKSWLEALVASELDPYDPESARARLPEDERTPDPSGDLEPKARALVGRSLRLRRLDPGLEGAFEDAVRGHVGLVLDLALVAGVPHDADRRRADVAASLAAIAGERGAALVADASPSPRTVARALRAAGGALQGMLFPPGDPRGGLPLFPGALAVSRRHLARVAMGQRRSGRLEPEALERHAGFAEREIVLLAEALAGACGGPADAHAEGVRREQLSRYRLSRAALGAARRAIRSPRPAAALGVAVPERVRPFLLEQLALAQLRAAPAVGPGAGAFVDGFAAAAGFSPEALAAARVEAAAQHGDHLRWFEVVAGKVDVAAVAAAWEARADVVVDRVTAAVSENLDALVTEIRQTGELGALLARAAAGQTLTSDERRKVKAQLIDLAKAVPALAIFAAPGGMLLLPVLAKLLPFSVLPSAWDKPKPTPVPALPPKRQGGA